MTSDGSAVPAVANARLAAIIVTYRRPDMLRSTLAALRTQSQPPDWVLVIDNDASPDTEAVVREHQSVVTSSASTYMASPKNLGPAGGISLGMEVLLGAQAPPDLVLLIDDDDPPPEDDSIERLLDLMAVASRTISPLAGVGLVGTRFDRRFGLMTRIPDNELVGVVTVDCIAGGQLPIYSADAIRSVGTFDEGLFFGFEELEFGLRLASKGWKLAVGGDTAMNERRRHNRVGLGRRERAHAGYLPSWRRFQSARNLVIISRRHCGRLTMFWVALRVGVVSPLRMLVERAGREARASVRGTLSGLRHRNDPPRDSLSYQPLRGVESP